MKENQDSIGAGQFKTHCFNFTILTRDSKIIDYGNNNDFINVVAI